MPERLIEYTDIKEELLEELKDSLDNGKEIPDKLFKKMSLLIAFDTHTEVKIINGRLKKVEAATAEQERQPSFLTLLHSSPKKTVAFIATILILTFLMLEVAWEYGLFPKLIELFGLPPLIP